MAAVWVGLGNYKLSPGATQAWLQSFAKLCSKADLGNIG